MAVSSPWDDDIMAPAFWGFVSFAMKDLLPQFESECGPLRLALDPLGHQIDTVTGHGETEAQRFVDWCVTQFGTPEQVYAKERD